MDFIIWALWTLFSFFSNPIVNLSSINEYGLLSIPNALTLLATTYGLPSVYPAFMRNLCQDFGDRNGQSFELPT